MGVLRPGNNVTPEERDAKSLVVQATIDRLEKTYADLIASQKGYDNIPAFFREHLYSPPNKEARDAALDNLYQKLKAVTGPEMTENVHKLILLNQLTDELDLETGKVLLAGPLKGVDNILEYPISDDELQSAIERAGRFDDRIRQITMVAESLDFFFSLSKLPLIKLVMAPIKVAASLVGAMDLVSTMEAGYELSRNIKDMSLFMNAFQEREKETLHAMMSRTAG